MSQRISKKFLSEMKISIEVFIYVAGIELGKNSICLLNSLCISENGQREKIYKMMATERYFPSLSTVLFFYEIKNR
jgi:hypothetical protein